jgi:hypothetical protein
MASAAEDAKATSKKKRGGKKVMNVLAQQKSE